MHKSAVSTRIDRGVQGAWTFCVTTDEESKDAHVRRRHKAPLQLTTAGYELNSNGKLDWETPMLGMKIV